MSNTPYSTPKKLTLDKAFYSEFKQLLRPHQLVHHHGKLAVAAYNKGDIKTALLEIAEVEAASVDVLSLLKSMEKSN